MNKDTNFLTLFNTAGKPAFLTFDASVSKEDAKAAFDYFRRAQKNQEVLNKIKQLVAELQD